MAPVRASVQRSTWACTGIAKARTIAPRAVARPGWRRGAKEGAGKSAFGMGGAAWSGRGKVECCCSDDASSSATATLQWLAWLVLLESALPALPPLPLELQW